VPTTCESSARFFFNVKSAVINSINYGAYKAAISANPGYIQTIIATNCGGGPPSDFYFGNFQLSASPPSRRARFFSLAFSL
jgi:hypothetical protein